MLYAEANPSTTSWIVSLHSDKKAVCILKVCTTEAEAKDYAHSINLSIIPHQRQLISKLCNLQTILTTILEKTGLKPTTSDEFILAIRQVVRYIEAGKNTEQKLI